VLDSVFHIVTQVGMTECLLAWTVRANDLSLDPSTQGCQTSSGDSLTLSSATIARLGPSSLSISYAATDVGGAVSCQLTGTLSAAR
jgi:hypothetical protein